MAFRCPRTLPHLGSPYKREDFLAVSFSKVTRRMGFAYEKVG
jgi:hypothetical protein